MNDSHADLARQPRQTTPLTATPPRSRWPVLVSAAFLMWCAWWYCREDSQGLLYLSAIIATLAALRPRPLPSTPRWVVWSGIALTIFCLAANVSRLMPPDNAPEESRALDRIITVAYAMGMTSLLFRPSVNTVSLAAIGGLPMSMLVLSRSYMDLGAIGNHGVMLVWGMVFLLAAADLAQRLTMPRTAEMAAPGFRELVWRVVCLVSVATIAFTLREPVEHAAKAVQKRIFGLVMYTDRRHRNRHTDLMLTAKTPKNFGGRMRMVMLLDTLYLPGYLREAVFLRYYNGRWTAIRPQEPLLKASDSDTGDKKGMHLLVPFIPPTSRASWHVEVLSPNMLAGFCLPGNALTLTCDGPQPLTEPNGMVTAAGAFPETYTLGVTPSRLLYSAYPYPDGFSTPDYLQIPEHLIENVSDWNSACNGLAEAQSLAVAIKIIEDHFSRNFKYRLGLRMRPSPDPLVDFMSRKEGACTLFASAAALMFRGLGIPSRVIGGYVCSEWNPWLKRWVVREREGHAWVEVFDRASGRWLVADPTPPAGNPAMFKRPGRLRWSLDVIKASLKRALSYLRNTNLLVMLADLGEDLFLLLWHMLASIPGVVAIAGLGALWWLRRNRRQPKLNSEARLRREMTRAMTRIARSAVPSHLRRRVFETWPAWFQRVRPELTATRSDALLELLESYQALRYSATLDTDTARAWLEHVTRP
ncbi:MAG: transglutaminase-like domain-containing protein [Kiritimatiellae bacterium]|nr:transglutaminase-like domain-containing protein [Kiritimatiellia bacterium]